MVNNKEMDRIFHAMSDTTRRQLIERITTDNPTVAELGEPFSISAPAISKHLKILEKANVITRIRDGRTNRFQFNQQSLMEAQTVLQQLTTLWFGRMSRLSVLLKERI